VLRFVASVLITSGILMLADAGLTLAWQEPVSAFFAAREQGRLAHKLDVEAAGVVARDKLLVASIRDVKRRLARLGAIERKRARTGDPIGRIKLPTLGRHYVVVQGTDTDTLRKGPGHYPSTVFPGEPGTMAIAGHRTTYGAPFRTIDQLKSGQHIVLAMPYGTFTYSITSITIVQPEDMSIVTPTPVPTVTPTVVNGGVAAIAGIALGSVVNRTRQVDLKWRR